MDERFEDQKNLFEMQLEAGQFKLTEEAYKLIEKELNDLSDHVTEAIKEAGVIQGMWTDVTVTILRMKDAAKAAKENLHESGKAVLFDDLGLMFAEWTSLHDLLPKFCDIFACHKEPLINMKDYDAEELQIIIEQNLTPEQKQTLEENNRKAEELVKKIQSNDVVKVFKP